MVDFPGVDDEDDSIGDLADLLLTIAQIIIFVVDYRYYNIIIPLALLTTIILLVHMID